MIGRIVDQDRGMAFPDVQDFFNVFISWDVREKGRVMVRGWGDRIAVLGRCYSWGSRIT